MKYLLDIQAHCLNAVEYCDFTYIEKYQERYLHQYPSEHSYAILSPTVK